MRRDMAMAGWEVQKGTGFQERILADPAPRWHWELQKGQERVPEQAALPFLLNGLK